MKVLVSWLRELVDVPVGIEALAERLHLAGFELASITPNAEMMGVFWMREPRTLYGRQTEIIQRGTRIGDIIEVLPLV